MKVIVVPCLHDNYSYLMFNEASHEAAVIDPSEAWPLLQELERNDLRLQAVLCTHHHADHIGGLEDLIEETGDVRVIGFSGEKSRIPLLTDLVDDGERFSVCGIDGQVFHTPGHTTGGVIYHLENCLFTGDTLFGAGCGRLFEGTPVQMLNSLEKLTQFSSDSLIYCGHEYTMVNLNFAKQLEPSNQDLLDRFAKVESLRAKGLPSVPSTLAEERNTNPFLRCGVETFVQQVAQSHQLTDTSPEKVFAFIREMRNSFS